ncbi:MAG: DUF1236 domain-containing protein [Burkholderiales bacterium]
MKRTLLAAAAIVALSVPAMAQTIVTTTTTERVAPLSLAPQQRTIIKRYVVERQVPVMHERVVVGDPVAQEVELQTVPDEWGPSVQRYRYVYADDHVAFVDPGTRRVVEILE